MVAGGGPKCGKGPQGVSTYLSWLFKTYPLFSGRAEEERYGLAKSLHVLGDSLADAAACADQAIGQPQTSFADTAAQELRARDRALEVIGEAGRLADSALRAKVIALFQDAAKPVEQEGERAVQARRALLIRGESLMQAVLDALSLLATRGLGAAFTRRCKLLGVILSKALNVALRGQTPQGPMQTAAAQTPDTGAQTLDKYLESLRGLMQSCDELSSALEVASRLILMYTEVPERVGVIARFVDAIQATLEEILFGPPEVAGNGETPLYRAYQRFPGFATGNVGRARDQARVGAALWKAYNSVSFAETVGAATSLGSPTSWVVSQSVSGAQHAQQTWRGSGARETVVASTIGDRMWPFPGTAPEGMVWGLWYVICFLGALWAVTQTVVFKRVAGLELPYHLLSIAQHHATNLVSAAKNLHSVAWQSPHTALTLRPGYIAPRPRSR